VVHFDGIKGQGSSKRPEVRASVTMSDSSLKAAVLAACALTWAIGGGAMEGLGKGDALASGAGAACGDRAAAGLRRLRLAIWVSSWIGGGA